MEFDIKDKVALVTCGRRGIGRATALTLASKGTHVAICGRTTEDLNQTAAELRERGIQCWIYQSDVSKPGEIEALIRDVGSDAGRIDILVNNAVTSTSASFDQLTDDQF